MTGRSVKRAESRALQFHWFLEQTAATSEHWNTSTSFESGEISNKSFIAF